MSEQVPVRWPRITVVTPVLNGAAHLRDTMASVIEQAYENLEYIVVDGGSTDGSLAIIQEHRGHVSRLIQGRDRTMYDAVAKGFDAASGEIFCWLNSDDMYMPGILQRIGRLFAAHPDWQVIHGDDAVWKQGWFVAHRPQRPVQLPELLRGHVLPQASTFFRRSAYEAVGGLEREKLRLAADYQLWIKLASRYELHFLPEHASVFRIRHNQLSGDWEKYEGEMQAVAQQALATLPADYMRRTRVQRAKRKIDAQRLLARRRFLYPLADERLNWPPVIEPSRRPLETCRCPLCDRHPSHLLFSAPDSRFGDRRLWRVYYCPRCETSFRYPHADAAVLQEIRQRVTDPDYVDLPDVPPGVYSPFRRYSVLRGSLSYRPLAALADTQVEASEFEDLVLPHEAADAKTLAVGTGEARLGEHLRRAKFTNVAERDVFDVPSESATFDAIVLGQSLQCMERPVQYLQGLKRELAPGGRIYLSMPNLDSRWLGRYGPCWSGWHLPFHAVLVGRRGLGEMAGRAGYRVRWVRTNTPRRWLYTSDQLSSRGLASHVRGDFSQVDASLWAAACGAALAGRWRGDRRGRGDCLHACLIAE